MLCNETLYAIFLIVGATMEANFTQCIVYFGKIFSQIPELQEQMNTHNLTEVRS